MNRFMFLSAFAALALTAGAGRAQAQNRSASDCVEVLAGSGAAAGFWVAQNNCSYTVSVAAATSTQTIATEFDLDPSATLSIGNETDGYKVWACTNPAQGPTDASTGKNPTYYSANVVCK
jgi:hypothetical protein